MSKSPIEYIKHILDEIGFLEQETMGYSEDQFMREKLTLLIAKNKIHKE